MIQIGTKFYKYDKDEKPELYRVISFQNSQTVNLRNEETKEKFKISLKDLSENYVSLTQHGLIIVNVVSVGGGKDDIIVSIHRNEEIRSKSGLPYCVCRQGITDIHAQQYSLNTGKEYFGASVSKDTIPAGIGFEIMVACENVYPNKTQTIAIYMDDTLDSIMELIKTEEYDKILNLLFLDHLQYASQKYGNFYYKVKLDTGECEGYCSTLRKLLDLNDFMYDFYRGFNIYPLDFDLKDLNEKPLPSDYIENLSFLLCKDIEKAMVIKYGYDISLPSITKDYVLILDKNNDLYVVVYTFSAILKISMDQIKNESIRKIYEPVRYNKSKFE